MNSGDAAATIQEGFGRCICVGVAAGDGLDVEVECGRRTLVVEATGYDWKRDLSALRPGRDETPARLGFRLERTTRFELATLTLAR